MLKIIAIIAAIRAFAARADFTLQDVQARVAGCALNATAQDIVLTVGNRENVRFTHNQCVEEISDKLRADINAAYKAHTDALQALGKSTDAIVAVHNEKLIALHAKRDVLRARLAEVS
mgnify:CR=1 FL=1